MGKLCGFLVGCEILNEDLYREKLKEKILIEVYKGNNIFAIQPNDKFNNFALDTCKELKKTYSNIQILFTSEDTTLYDFDIIYYATDKDISFEQESKRYINILNQTDEYVYPPHSSSPTYFLLK